MNSGYSSDAKTNSQANKLSDDAKKSNSITQASKVKYSVRAQQIGSFTALPAKIESMYHPHQIQANTTNFRLTIKEKK